MANYLRISNYIDTILTIVVFGSLGVIMTRPESPGTVTVFSLMAIFALSIQKILSSYQNLMTRNINMSRSTERSRLLEIRRLIAHGQEVDGHTVVASFQASYEADEDHRRAFGFSLPEVSAVMRSNNKSESNGQSHNGDNLRV